MLKLRVKSTGFMCNVITYSDVLNCSIHCSILQNLFIRECRIKINQSALSIFFLISKLKILSDISRFQQFQKPEVKCSLLFTESPTTQRKLH